jgi:hypothetical protein
MRKMLTIALVCGLGAAHAADTVLTLACQGTITTYAEDHPKPAPISMGIIINFTNRTVQGFGYPGSSPTNFPVRITAMDDVTVVFSGSDGPPTEQRISGTIDRVTGDVGATLFTGVSGTTFSSTDYSLKCRPAQRMF